MHADGCSPMCGHAVIAVTTIVRERQLLSPKRAAEIVFDSPAGVIRARPHAQELLRTGSKSRTQPPIRISSVAFTNVPSFVYEAGAEVRLKSRTVRADIAFGGAFYAIVDAESAGLAIDGTALAQLRAIGMEIRRAIEASRAVVHPLDPGLCGVDGTIFIGPARSPEADLRNATVFGDAQVDRSPCGTGVCAVMAVLDAMSLLPPRSSPRPREHHRDDLPRADRGAAGGERLRSDRAGGRRHGVDYRRARVRDRRERSPEVRLSAVTPPERSQPRQQSGGATRSPLEVAAMGMIPAATTERRAVRCPRRVVAIGNDPSRDNGAAAERSSTKSRSRGRPCADPIPPSAPRSLDRSGFPGSPRTPRRC